MDRFYLAEEWFDYKFDQQRKELKVKDTSSLHDIIRLKLSYFDYFRGINDIWNQGVTQINEWFLNYNRSHEYILNDRIKVSSDGVEIYNTRKDDDDYNYITKVITILDSFDNWIDPIREVLIGCVMSLIGVGPKVDDAWFSYEDEKAKLYIVQEKVKGMLLGEWFINVYAPSYHEYLKKPLCIELCNKLKNQVKIMHEMKIVHSDLHGGNIFILDDTDALFIDYGLSRTWYDIEYKIKEDEKGFQGFIQSKGLSLSPKTEEQLMKDVSDQWQELIKKDYKSILGPSSYGLCDRITRSQYEIIQKTIYI